MKPNRKLILVFVVLSLSLYASAQKDSTLTTEVVIQNIIAAHEAHGPFHYDAQMQSQFFGHDTFEIRNFIVSYRPDPENFLYGYDWEISEERTIGMLTYMALPDALYMIVSANKSMNYQSLIQRVPEGDYAATLNDYLITDEAIAPFTMIRPDKIEMSSSGGMIHLRRQMNAKAFRELVVHKDSYLPIESRSTIYDDAIDLTQIIEIHFDLDSLSMQLPDTALSPGHYLSLGYRLNIIEEEDSQVKEQPASISSESKKDLFAYPFVSSGGDTMNLAEIEAKYILLDFWYASCLPCLKAMPEMNQLCESYSSTEVQCIGVNCFDLGIREQLISKLRQRGITMPLWFATRDLCNKLGIHYFPSYVLITRGGDITYVDGGVEEVRRVLEEALGK